MTRPHLRSSRRGTDRANPNPNPDPNPNPNPNPSPSPSPSPAQARHRPLRALHLLSGAMDRLPIDEKKKVEMDKSVILLGEASETCERIFASPVPLG